MKILFLVRTLAYGGAERQLVTLARGLKARGHSVVVVVFYPGGVLEHELRDAGIPIRSANKKGRWDAVGFLARLIGIARHEKPDIMHGYLILPNLLTAVLRLFCPGAKAVWGIRDSNVASERYDLLERFTFRVESWMSGLAHLVIANSHAGAKIAVSRGFPQQATIVIPNGIDTERFMRDEEARVRTRDEFGIGKDEKAIGLIGRLDPTKDHPNLIRAAALLLSSRSDLRFILVGDGPEAYRAELETLSEELGVGERIIWAPARRNVTEIYSALDINVCCSDAEGFSNVVGEAMACGVPCVVTDVGDSAWIVNDPTRVVAPRSAEALAFALDALLTKIDEGGLDQAGTRQRIADNFSVEKLVNRTESALLRSLETRGSIQCQQPINES